MQAIPLVNGSGKEILQINFPSCICKVNKAQLCKLSIMPDTIRKI